MNSDPPRVLAELCYADVRAAAEWLCRVFGMQEQWRRTAPDGALRSAGLALDTAAISICSPGPALQAPSESAEPSARLIVIIDDVDAHHAKVLEQGARILFPPESKAWGLRRYEVLDLEGHVWQFNQHLRNVDPAEWGAVTHRPRACR